MDAVAPDVGPEGSAVDRLSCAPSAPSAFAPPTSTPGLGLRFRGSEEGRATNCKCSPHPFSSLNLRSPLVPCARHPSPAPSRRASLEWHLDGFDSTVPGAASFETLSPYQNLAYPPFHPPLEPTVPSSPPADRRANSFSPPSNAALHPSSDPTWELSVPPNSFSSDTAPRLERCPSRADRPAGLGLDLQRTASEHPPSILAHPSDYKPSISTAIQYVLSFPLIFLLNKILTIALWL